MIDNTSKISLTYQIGGEYLLTSGQYSVAELNHNKKDKDGNPTIQTPSVIKAQPTYHKAKCHIMLPYSFIEESLKPLEKLKEKEDYQYADARLRWKTWTEKMKLNFHVTRYVSDMRGSNPEWELV
jgi:hypothetical protein